MLDIYSSDKLQYIMRMFDLLSLAYFCISFIHILPAIYSLQYF